ncbi:kinase-like domain-containing protein [Aspergillus floccosus]
MTSMLKRTFSLRLPLRLRLIHPNPRTRDPLVVPPRGRTPSQWSGFAFTSSSRGRSTPTNTEEPRKSPTSGYESIEADQPVEVETLSDYRAYRFYPVQLGEVFNDRYQAIAKLGYGSSSTTWLARDLRACQYVALKIYVHTSLVHCELPAYDRIASRISDSSHGGRGNLRRLLDSFEAKGPDGSHIVLVFEAAQMSLQDMKNIFRPDGFDADLVKGAIIELLQAVDFLHTQGEIIHTDIHPGNMLLGVVDNSIFRAIEKEEYTDPVPRKQVSSTRMIYLSRLMRPKAGPMLLSDFGEARIGCGPHSGEIMPLEYRAPETLLYVDWSYPVDMWSVGLTAWDLREPKRLFTAVDKEGGLYDATHLAQMIAALGSPPAEFLDKNPERRADFWNDDGKRLGLAPIPEGRTMEALVTRLDDPADFLRFIRRALTWIPEERATAKELLDDPWLADGER